MKELFLLFTQLRDSGWYNMISDKDHIIGLLGCSEEQYYDLIENYNKYQDKFIYDN